MGVAHQPCRRHTDGVFSPRRVSSLRACLRAALRVSRCCCPRSRSACRPNLHLVLDWTSSALCSQARRFHSPIQRCLSTCVIAPHPQTSETTPYSCHSCSRRRGVHYRRRRTPLSTAGRPSRLVTAIRRSACNAHSRFPRRLNSAVSSLPLQPEHPSHTKIPSLMRPP
jgi:hypothetical protein